MLNYMSNQEILGLRVYLCIVLFKLLKLSGDNYSKFIVEIFKTCEMIHRCVCALEIPH